MSNFFYFNLRLNLKLWLSLSKNATYFSGACWWLGCSVLHVFTWGCCDSQPVLPLAAQRTSKVTRNWVTITASHVAWPELCLVLCRRPTWAGPAAVDITVMMLNDIKWITLIILDQKRVNKLTVSILSWFALVVRMLEKIVLCKTCYYLFVLAVCCYVYCCLFIGKFKG